VSEAGVLKLSPEQVEDARQAIGPEVLLERRARFSEKEVEISCRLALARVGLHAGSLNHLMRALNGWRGMRPGEWVDLAEMNLNHCGVAGDDSADVVRYAHSSTLRVGFVLYYD